MNKRKPTKKEVKQNKEHGVWWSYQGKQYWDLVPVDWVHLEWTRGDRWLPYSALPDPRDQLTKKGRKT